MYPLETQSLIQTDGSDRISTRTKQLHIYKNIHNIILGPIFSKGLTL